MARTDDDSWDLASSVGATATMVAAARAVATRSPKAVIDDRFAEPLVRAVGVDFFSRMAAGELDADALDSDDGRFGIDRFADAMAARTLFFDGVFADAAATGVRQGVILASGLDARGWRLDWPADMVVYEVDQPEVIAFKTATLASLDATPTADLRPIAIDLRQDWPAALAEAGFDPTAPTAWIAEGLVMYLPADAQDRLLDAITELSAPGSWLAVEAVSPPEVPLDPDEQRERALKSTERWRNHGFDLDFSELVYTDARTEVPAYLGGLGWQTTVLDGNDMLTRYGLDPVERDENAGRPIYITATR
ncbi:putative S-adenosyl-L-methionine-dependent methyltransferase [Mycolicibacterium insubricum]|uniref:S-adenosyl-L-methionine-dependent methyltransferase n=3 Tax=Mycolicibacterium insubricum TaxID=444597 RepID=A0A1X0DDL5_9MYCO|nr:class I SAM-dependent methyltransferase [Mycolicibacterium insubricum]MCB9440948.1 class I SAM-dependent methyltransferase [Mycolicibacterium sp.]ORA69880.1 SAM-dependent methyltransferase [Mycolicibacterium insubricum]BBZ65961.1 putative S-adenosyl-L-methionine-dependent methyltransferase [Mycolicibacterium insubricum]